MITDYIFGKLAKARYKILKDRAYFGEVPGMPGVWASAKNLEDCRAKLKEVLEDWLVLALSRGETVPGFKVRVPRKTLTAVSK